MCRQHRPSKHKPRPHKHMKDCERVLHLQPEEESPFTCQSTDQLPVKRS